MKTNKDINGFSLVELLIVVAIIGIIAALAVPNFMAARRAANEGSSESSLRSINSAEATYQSTIGQGNYASMNELSAAKLVDGSLASNTKSGYSFIVTETDLVPGTSLATFKATCIPTIPSGSSQTGARKFGITQSGVIHVQTDALDIHLTDAELALTTNVLGN